MPERSLRLPERAHLRPTFQKALLGLSGGPTDELVVELGCQLAKASGASLVAVHVVEVDWRHDLSEDLTGGDDRATSILERAEAVAQRVKVPMTADLLQARDIGAALVDEALEQGADAMLVGLPYRKRFGGDFALGTTVPYVFQNAPCQVIVVREPVATSEERRMAAAGPAPAAARSW
jgi:nucleotide-binding universal stress UspA family protein